jgi:hypothetical protein
MPLPLLAWIHTHYQIQPESVTDTWGAGNRSAPIDTELRPNRRLARHVDAGRDGEIRYMGEFDASPESMTRLIKKLAAKHDKLHFCYEAVLSKIRKAQPDPLMLL